MDFVLTLHSHMPYVVHHGRWPHGSDWLCEGAVDTYLPLLEALLQLEKSKIPAPVTLGITPVLATQLSHPDFVADLQDYFEHRIEACEVAPASLKATGDAALIPLAAFWLERFRRLYALWKSTGFDLVGAFRALEERGRLEILSSCATHGFLPLLGRDESIRFQLAAGRAEHQRLFGREPRGLWLPECAYRPAGRWAPEGARPVAHRPATHEYLAEAGYRYFFVDSHLPNAGPPLDYDGEMAMGTTAEAWAELQRKAFAGDGPRSPYHAYKLSGKRGRTPIAAYVRDPDSTLRVWSRHLGYPGDGAYLEFHKIRWPEGLKLWRVTGGDVDLGAKQSYDAAAAFERARVHARHFAGILGDAKQHGKDGEVVAAPFDTELFGHWWFEGVEFLRELYVALQGTAVHPVTAGRHLETHPTTRSAELREGSWGANGDFSMWMNPGTEWTWKRMWPLEDRFWAAARTALAAGPMEHAVLEQAARSLLLAQASDWQFIISTGAAVDYAERRFSQHCEDAEHLVASLEDSEPGALEAGMRYAESLRDRDDVFPDVLESVAKVAAGAPGHPASVAGT